jgi:hypothetical protein
MKLISHIVFLIFCCQAQAQRSPSQPCSQKFYKINKVVYGMKPYHSPFDFTVFSYVNDRKVSIDFPSKHVIFLGMYPNTYWDINETFLIFQKHTRFGDLLSYYPKKDFSDFVYSAQKNQLSANLNGLTDWIDAKFTPALQWEGYKCYDLVLRTDSILVMPIAFRDTLAIFSYHNKIWTDPDFKGAEKHPENDFWRKDAAVAHPFKTGFRAFQIKNDLYFVANSDTMLYKFEDGALKHIGKIKRNMKDRLLYLIDKEDYKVHFMFAETLDVIPEERERFRILRRGDPLHKAVKKILDEPEIY